MSRTYRNNPMRARSRWFRRLEPMGDSKPFDERFVCKDVGKFKTWRCRCEDYCIPGKLHKHKKAEGFPILWELKQLE